MHTHFILQHKKTSSVFCTLFLIVVSDVMSAASVQLTDHLYLFFYCLDKCSFVGCSHVETRRGRLLNVLLCEAPWMGVCVCIDRPLHEDQSAAMWAKGGMSCCEEEDEEAPVSGACWHKRCN